MSDPNKQWWNEPRPPREEIIWTMADGSKIRLSEMDDRHLLNSIRMLREQDEQDSLICLHMYAEAIKRGIWSRDANRRAMD